MSDLVGNPEDRFSRVAAHMSFNNLEIDIKQNQKESKTSECSVQL